MIRAARSGDNGNTDTVTLCSNAQRNIFNGKSLVVCPSSFDLYYYVTAFKPHVLTENTITSLFHHHINRDNAHLPEPHCEVSYAEDTCVSVDGGVSTLHCLVNPLTIDTTTIN